MIMINFIDFVNDIEEFVHKAFKTVCPAYDEEVAALRWENKPLPYDSF